MTAVVAPVLPHLAEEIHGTLHTDDERRVSTVRFAKTWAPVSVEWNNPQAEQDMASLL
ncbi:hypothetical protein M405DRAFT_815833, partial [Rhizopogon salebrosus TDB-379]